ncbi:MAG: hypothetical protein LBH38_04240 [Holosporales bacterium]|jgi:hypothetical protein|nr:hypothetical protein [Holosporales bacterium]
MAKFQKLCLCIVCVYLCGCSADKESASVTELFYQTPIALDTANVSMVRAFHPTELAPHLEHLVTPSFPEVVESWAEKCLIPSGAHGQTRVIIEEASICAFPVAEPQGFFASTFTTPKVQYTAQCLMTLEKKDAAKAPAYSHRIQVSVNKVAERDISAEKRDTILRTIMREILERLHAELIKIGAIARI